MNNTSKYCNYIIQFCLCGLIFFLPFAKAAVQTFAWMAIATWLVKNIILHRLKIVNYFSRTPVNVYLLIFATICLISTILSLNFGCSLKALFTKTTKLLLLFFIIIETAESKRRFKGILLAIVLSAFLIAIDAGVQYFRGVDLLRGYASQGIRLRASFGNPVGFGAWLITIIPILLGIIIYYFRNLKGNKLNKFKASVLISLTIILIACLISTFSRACWLAFLIGLFPFIWIGFRKLSIYKKIFTIIFVVIACILITSFTPLTFKEYSSFRSWRISSINIRLDLWKQTLEIIEDFPLFGTGPNTYSKICDNYLTSNYAGMYSHNSYLQLTAEIGIIGLLAFLWFLFNLIKLIISSFIKNKDYILLGFLSSIIGFIIHSFFDDNFFALQLAALFWVVMGLAVARVNLLSKDEIGL